MEKTAWKGQSDKVSLVCWLAGLLAFWIAGWLVRAQASEQAHKLLIEAEDFKPAKASAWKPIKAGEGNYYFATLANTFISRQKLLSAPEQCEYSEATITTDIPADGQYLVWTRYECPSWWSVEHTLRIEQGGKAVFERKYGALQNPKLWPFGKGIQPMVQWDWGSGDNVVWEPSDQPVELKKGKATFTLIAERQPEDSPNQRGAARRNIDCIFLTTDVEDGIRDAAQAFYHRFDKHLNQAGECFIRITNPKEAPAPIVAQVRIAEHNPYWQKRGPTPERIGARGEFKGKPADADWIAPGQSSPWVAIGQALDTTNMQELYVTVQRKAQNGGMDVMVEFSSDPEGKKLIRKVRYQHPEVNTVIFEIPHDLRTDKRVRTLEEWHEGLLAFLKKLPKKGRVPTHVPVYGIMGGNWHGRVVKVPDAFYRLRTETGSLLGRNTWKKGEVPDDLAKQYGVKPQKNLAIDVRDVPTPQLEQYLLDLKAKGELDQVLIVSMGDEIGVGGYDPNSKKDQAEFRDYLRRLRAMDAATRGKEYAIYAQDIPDPDTARLTRDPNDAKNYYWSQMFSIDRGIDELKVRTEIVERVMGQGRGDKGKTNDLSNVPRPMSPAVFTGANYSPHPHYYPKVGQWVRLFRRRGMTMPWTEDWTFQIPEVSPQVIAYLMDVFRCAAKYHDMPIHCYTMPHYPGQTARDFTLSFYSALAHGNKVINFFAAVPIYDYTENYISWEAYDNWKAVYDVVHEVGMADDIIWNGRVRPAQVAILLSHTTDIWEEARGSSIYNFERKNLYYALRHAQIPVDFLTEEDVVEGWLTGGTGHGSRVTGHGYKVLYVCGDHMLRACAEKIRDWVRDGGHLFSVAGGGFMDEYNQPLDVLNEVYGIADQKLTITEKNLWAKEGLAWVKPLGKITSDLPSVLIPWAVWEFPALIARQELTKRDSKNCRVVGRFDDGKPAVVFNATGRGTAALIGTFIGSVYVHGAIPKRVYDRGSSDENFNHFLPTQFNEHLLSFITAPRSGSHVKTSESLLSLIDATVIEAPQGIVVPMANYSGKPIKELTVTIRDVPEFKRIYSVKRGALKYQRQGKDITVTLPLEWADMIVIRR